MEHLRAYLPLLLPLVLVQCALLGYALYHILTHKNYKRGSRGLWLCVVIVGMAYIGPIAYFLFGKEE